MNYEKFKDINYERLLNEYTLQKGIPFLQEPDEILAFENFLQSKHTEWVRDNPTQPKVTQSTTQPIPSPTTQGVASYTPPQTLVPETEEALLITNGYQKVLGCVLHNKFFPVSSVELTDELLFDLIERGVINSSQAKEMKRVDLF